VHHSLPAAHTLPLGVASVLKKTVLKLAERPPLYVAVEDGEDHSVSRNKKAENALKMEKNRCPLKTGFHLLAILSVLLCVKCDHCGFGDS
jgi:hypothetical protein